MVRPIVIAAGGTGGHVFPAEALAAALIARGRRIVLMTDARSGALRSAVFAGGEQFVLAGGGLAGQGVGRALRGALGLVAGTLQARALLARLNASVVVGFGGYPCVPPVLATLLVRPRPAVILHEQNAVLGRANRALARLADVLALGFAETARLPAGVRTQVTGNPVRPAIAALGGVAAPDGDRFELLVIGGSLGARVFSEVVPAAIAALPDASRARLRVVQQCRAEDLARVRAAYDAAGVSAELAPFFADIAERLRVAHLVVSRAGASSCAELAASGRAAILVPLPGAIDDHQMANAACLEGACVVAQPDFTSARLCALLAERMEDPAGLRAAGARMAACARLAAANDLADLVESLAERAEAVP